MELQPNNLPAGAAVKGQDGSWTLTLRPEFPAKWNQWCLCDGGEMLPFGQPFSKAFETTIMQAQVSPQPGSLPALGDEWLLWEIHHPMDIPHGNAPVALFIKGGQVRVDIQYNFHDPVVQATKTQQVVAGPWPLEIGVAHKWEVSGQFGAAGWLKIRRDGVLVCDYAGPFGYAETKQDYFWKFGPYAYNVPWQGKIVAKVKF